MFVVLAALCSLLGGCASHNVTRGGVVEVTFWTRDVSAQSRVAAGCELTLLSRVAPEQVRYAFKGERTQPLTCLHRKGLVRATAQPL